MGNLGNMQSMLKNMPPGAIENAMKSLTPEKINEALENPQMQKMMESMGLCSKCAHSSGHAHLIPLHKKFENVELHKKFEKEFNFSFIFSLFVIFVSYELSQNTYNSGFYK